MSAQENKDKMRRFLEEAFGQGKAEVVDELLHSDFVCWDPNSETGEIRGAQTIKSEIEYFRNAVPDLTYTVEDQIAEGDKVLMRWTARGTHQGELQGLPPTGKRVKVAGMVISRSAEGKFVESWEVYDTLGMMRQLGLVVIPGPRLLGRMLVGQAKKLGARLPTRR